MNPEKELVEQLLAESRKRTLYSKITAFSSAGILLTILIFLIIFLPGLTSAAGKINEVAAQAEEITDKAENTLTQIETTVADFDEMSKSLSETSENINQFVTDNSTVLADTAKQLGNIDYDSLNKAIKDLQAAVEPFANFVNRFK